MKKTFNHAATTKSDGNAFTNIVTMAKVWPLYEWLNELVKQNQQETIRLFLLDWEDNDLHWEYPYNKADTI